MTLLNNLVQQLRENKCLLDGYYNLLKIFKKLSLDKDK